MAVGKQGGRRTIFAVQLAPFVNAVMMMGVMAFEHLYRVSSGGRRVVRFAALKAELAGEVVMSNLSIEQGAAYAYGLMGV